MNPIRIHLMLNHVAIVGVVFGTIWLIHARIFKSPAVSRAARYTLLFTSLISFVVMKSGEGAEESLEQLSGVSESIISEHEDAASVAIWIAGIAGGLALFSILLEKRLGSFAKTLESMIILFGLAASLAMINVGRLGGKIRHTELSGTTPQATGSDLQRGQEQEDDD